MKSTVRKLGWWRHNKSKRTNALGPSINLKVSLQLDKYGFNADPSERKRIRMMPGEQTFYFSTGQGFMIARRCIVLWTAAWFAATMPVPGFGTDWPTHHANSGRQAYIATTLQLPLQPQWIYVPTASPRPAWPAPARGSYWQELDRLEPRVVDDHAFHTVATSDSVYFGSSADDHIYCLAADTGQTHGPLLPTAPYDTRRLFTKAGFTLAATMGMCIVWMPELDGSFGGRE